MSESTQLVEYNITDSTITELAAKHDTKTMDASTTKGYKLVSAGIGEIRCLRVSVEKRRIELKADALSWGRRVDSEAKRITALLLNIEQPMKQLKQEIDDEKARAKAAKEAAERDRIDAIQSTIREISRAPVLVQGGSVDQIDSAVDAMGARQLETDEFGEFLESAMAAKNTALRELVDMRAKRVEFEQEQTRLASEKQRQDEEIARLAATQAKIDLQQRQLADQQKAAEDAERERQAKVAAEEAKRDAAHQAKIAADQNRLDDQRAAVERDRLALELKEKAEREAREKLEREAKAKADREKAEAAERERIERQRPDAQKLRFWLERDIAHALTLAPRLNDSELREIVDDAAAQISNIVDGVSDQVGDDLWGTTTTDDVRPLSASASSEIQS